MSSLASSLTLPAVLNCRVASSCGGCPLIEHSPSSQRSRKLGLVRDQLWAVGLRAEPSWLAVAQRGYRNRLRLKLEAGCPKFFNAQKASDCSVLCPDLKVAMVDFMRWAKGERDYLAQFGHLELRAPDLDGLAGVSLTLTGAEPSAGSRNLLSENLSARLLPPSSWPSNFYHWVEGIGQAPAQRFALSSELFTCVPLGSFMQVNTEVNQALVAKVVSGARLRRANRFLDLYSGSGNFALALLQAGCVGSAIELDSAAIDAARHSALEQGLNPHSFECAHALEAAETRAQNGERFDLVLVDPPRAGLKGRLRAIASLARHSVVLCYCSVESFARDAASLSKLGFVLEEVSCVDMFPQTVHVEILAWFKRN